jgi:hypothetical protein
MAECRNPECRKGYTPGVIVVGKGNANAPVVGSTMRYGWVNCRACSPKDKDPPYSHVARAPAEIQERARLADQKAPYVNQAPAQRPRLEALASTVAPAAPVPNSNDRLLSQIEKLTDQVSELLEENRALRRRLDSEGTLSPPLKKIVKNRKGGNGTKDCK